MRGRQREPAILIRVRVEVVVDRAVGGGVHSAQAEGEASESLARTEEPIVGGFVTDLFALNGILLVIELQGGELYGGDIRVIQRCVEGIVDGPVEGEMDVLELEGLGASFRRGRVQVLGGSEEPPDSDEDEIDEVGVEDAILFVLGVEGFGQSSQDGDVGRVGPAARVVFVFHGLEESRE